MSNLKLKTDIRSTEKNLMLLYCWFDDFQYWCKVNASRKFMFSKIWKILKRIRIVSCYDSENKINLMYIYLYITTRERICSSPKFVAICSALFWQAE